MTLDGWLAARNGRLEQTASIQAATGLGCTGVAALLLFVVFFFFIGLGWLRFGAAWHFACAATSLYLAVAGWAAHRQVDPLAALAPLTRAEQTRREVEDALRDALGVGGPEKVLRREAIAGFADFLVAGPRNLVRAWRTWRQRVRLDPALSARCDRLLTQAGSPAGAPVEADPRAAATLALLGLVRPEPQDDGGVLLRVTPRGRELNPTRS
jgi:hypothetical protein